MNYEQFHARFGQFTEKLYRLLDEDESRTWNRYNKEVYNHKMVAEISMWYGPGPEERGHVFLATAGTWDGSVDWDRVKEIVSNDALALGPDDNVVKVWDLAQLVTQTEPRARCNICGKVV